MKVGTATLGINQKPSRKFVMSAEIYQERFNNFKKNDSHNDVCVKGKIVEFF